MMKYTGKYYRLFTLFLKKHLKEQYGSEITKKALKKAPAIYKDMLAKCDDIGYDNPMAGNIYMCFVFLAIWKAADGAIDPDSYRIVVNNFMRSGIVAKFMSGNDINKPEGLQKAKEKFHAMQAWADAHPQYRRKNGFLEVLPVCCEIDYITTEYSHGVLHRDYTLASGGDICDYWIVPDQIKDPR